MGLRSRVVFSLSLGFVFLAQPVLHIFFATAYAQNPSSTGASAAPEKKPSSKSQQKASPKTPAAAVPPQRPAPVAPEAPSQSPGDLQPVLHAQGAKITTCMDTILRQSAAVIDSSHTAISSWQPSAANENIFQSIIGLNYASKIAPNAAAVIFAAPLTQSKCEGATVQVYPTAQPCSVIQANLIKEGKTIATLQSLPVVEIKNGTRHVLLPGVAGSCIIVAVKLY